MALALLGSPLLAGCSGGATMSDMLSTDLVSKDAQWFSRAGRVFNKNVSIETPPLTPEKPVTAEDFVSADGQCPGMAPPTDANASSEAPAAAGAVQPSLTGHVALGHTECDVVRGAGVPANVNLSSGPGGERVAVLTYTSGARAGIYTFRSGRLSSIERLPETAAPPKPTRSKPAKRRHAT